MAAVGLAGSSCDGLQPDPRIATPRLAVDGLLRATHSLTPAPQASPPRGSLGLRLRREHRGEERPPPDLRLLALCVLDFDRDDPSSRAMADFVAGMLAAGQHGLRYEVGESHATVITGLRPVRLRRTSLGWQVVLRDTVPEDIQRDLRRARQPELQE